jgi:protein TonB
MRFRVALFILALSLTLAAQQNGPFRIGSGVSAPIPTFKPEPQLSEADRALGVNGEVLMTLVIDEKGIPTEIKVTRSLHPQLDARAIETLTRWRFKPGFKDGNAVAVHATLSMSFRILQ